MADPPTTQASLDRREDNQLKLAYAVFESEHDALHAGRQGETRQVTLLHTSFGRGLVEPAEDRSCPT